MCESVPSCRRWRARPVHQALLWTSATVAHHAIVVLLLEAGEAFKDEGRHFLQALKTSIDAIKGVPALAASRCHMVASRMLPLMSMTKVMRFGCRCRPKAKPSGSPRRMYTVLHPVIPSLAWLLEPLNLYAKWPLSDSRPTRHWSDSLATVALSLPPPCFPSTPHSSDKQIHS